MNDSMKKLRIAAQAQSALLGLQTRRAVRRAVLLVVASLFGLFAIAILNFAAFEALDRLIGAIGGGAIVGATNLLVAGLLVRSAFAEQSEGDEERLARQLSEMSYASLSDDIDAARTELQSFAADVRSIRGVVGAFTSSISGSMGTLFQMLKALDPETGSSAPRATAPSDAE